MLLLPTAGTHYRIAEVDADPIRLNSNLGRYTNFVNLMDLAAVAVPAGFTPAKLPFGISLIAPAWSDGELLALAERVHAASVRTLGAGGNGGLPFGPPLRRVPASGGPAPGCLPCPASRHARLLGHRPAGIKAALSAAGPRHSDS